MKEAYKFIKTILIYAAVLYWIGIIVTAGVLTTLQYFDVLPLEPVTLNLVNNFG